MSERDFYTMPDEAPEPPPEERAPVSEPPPARGQRRETVPALSYEAGLPASIDGERTILGSILLDSAYFNEAAEKIEAEDFSLDSHQRIFLRMSELMNANQAVDVVTLTAELERHKEIESVGGRAYLFSLTESLPRRPVISDYVALVKDKSMLRKLMLISSNVIARAADQGQSAMEILEAAEGQLLQIAQDANAGKLRTIYSSVEQAGGTDTYLKQYTEPSLKTGLQTGFTDYDRLTGGLQPAELTIIAARPSMGKTALAINLIENVCCGTDKVVAFFSLEMSRSAIERRFMASRARVDIRRAMDGWFLSAEEKRKLENALGDLVEAKIYIDDSSSLTPIQMRAKARRLQQREGRIDLAICDYLQLLSAGIKTSNRQEEISAVSRSLKACAKELSCPVVALAQLNRSPEQRQDKRPMLSDLRESGQIEQDADVVTMIHRDSVYDPENEDKKGLADLIICKQRNGATGIIKMAFEGSLTRFDNLIRR